MMKKNICIIENEDSFVVTIISLMEISFPDDVKEEGSRNYPLLTYPIKSPLWDEDDSCPE